MFDLISKHILLEDGCEGEYFDFDCIIYCEETGPSGWEEKYSVEAEIENVQRVNMEDYTCK